MKNAVLIGLANSCTFVSRGARLLTGQAVLEEVRAYMAENEAITRAMVTRIKANESENAALKNRLMKMESRVRSLTILCLILAIVVSGLTLVVVLHWILR